MISNTSKICAVMLQRINLPPAVWSFLFSVMSLPRAALERYSTLAKFRRIFLQSIGIDEAEQLLADDLDVLLVQDLAIDEVDHRNVADRFDFEAATTSG